VPILYDYSNAIILAILGASSMTHEAPESARQAPMLALSGAPARVARPAVFYTFSPTVVRRGAADSLTFSIENKPAWASFGRRHGTLYGVPHARDAGTYPDIRITVTDGTMIANLEEFTLEVTPGAARPANRARGADAPTSK
jgi:hypothetical protein